MNHESKHTLSSGFWIASHSEILLEMENFVTPLIHLAILWQNWHLLTVVGGLQGMHLSEWP